VVTTEASGHDRYCPSITSGPSPSEPQSSPSAEAAALVAAGRLHEAAAAARLGLLDRITRAEAAQLHVVLAGVLYLFGETSASVVEAQVALDESAAGEPTLAAAQVLLLRSLMAKGERAGARRRSEALLAGEDGRGGSAALTGALLAMGQLSWEHGRVPESLSLVRAAAGRASRSLYCGELPDPRLDLVDILISLDEFEEVESLLESLESLHEDAGAAWVPALAALRCRFLMAAGQAEQAVVVASAATHLAESLGICTYVASLWATLAVAALRRGDLKEAAHLVSRCRTETSLGGWTRSVSEFVWAETGLVEAQQGGGRALETLRSDRRPDTFQLLLENPLAGPWWVRTALRTGERRQATTVAITLQDLAFQNPGVPALTGASQHADGLLQDDPDLLLDVATQHRRPWLAASASEDAALALSSQGRAVHLVRSALERALKGYTRTAASNDSARIRRRLRALDRRERSGCADMRPVSGWSSLTEAERRVALAVGEGLTNAQAADRLCLSRYTVDFHLRQTFRKLDIRSRVELARLSALETETVPLESFGAMPEALDACTTPRDVGAENQIRR
jgi:DNA-binding CsgD family transcriptional regulator